MFYESDELKCEYWLQFFWLKVSYSCFLFIVSDTIFYLTPIYYLWIHMHVDGRNRSLCKKYQSGPTIKLRSESDNKYFASGCRALCPVDHTLIYDSVGRGKPLQIYSFWQFWKSYWIMHYRRVKETSSDNKTDHIVGRQI